VLGEHLDKFIIVYFNNIIIYLDNEEKYKKNMLNGFYRNSIIKKILIAIKKCEFYITKTDFIGFIIKLKYISIDLKKIKAIVNWQDLENVIGLKLFLGFCNYYRQFIIKWLDKIKPFTRKKKDKL